VSPSIQTVSGKIFDFENPTPDMVCIEDIAHSLAYLCRFTGHSSEFYSVAHHSVLVSEILPPNLQLVGLLHDAAETYVGDVSRPLKAMLPEYEVIEARVWRVIALKFGLPEDLPWQVKQADNVLLVTEKRDLMVETDRTRESWAGFAAVKPLPKKLERWTSWMAKKIFLERFHSF